MQLYFAAVKLLKNFFDRGVVTAEHDSSADKYISKSFHRYLLLIMIELENKMVPSKHQVRSEEVLSRV